MTSRIAGYNPMDVGLDNPGLGLYSNLGVNPGVNLMQPKKPDDSKEIWDLVMGEKKKDQEIGFNFHTGKELTKTALDVASLVPGIGAASSVVKAGISGLEGNWGEAAIDLASAIPFAGTGIKGLKLGSKLSRFGSKLGRIAGFKPFA